eukprot:12562047-Alexandrium_andersonii.AAC.1
MYCRLPAVVRTAAVLCSASSQEQVLAWTYQARTLSAERTSRAFAACWSKMGFAITASIRVWLRHRSLPSTVAATYIVFLHLSRSACTSESPRFTAPVATSVLEDAAPD